MVVEYGIMSNKWSVEAEDKLVCYATILIHLGSNGYNMVMLYNEECKNDQWAFSDNTEKRLKEIFGEDVFAFMDKHADEIKKAVKTIKKTCVVMTDKKLIGKRNNKKSPCYGCPIIPCTSCKTRFENRK